MVASLPSNIETWSNTAANAAQIAAIIIGGWWAYNRFIREREKWPRVTLEQSITHRTLNADHALLRVDLRVHNAGEVLLELTKARAEAYQVLPLTQATAESLSKGTLIRDDDHQADWPCLVDYEQKWEEQRVEIEPQETDELGFDFVVPDEVETLFLYSYIWNVSKHDREIGWPTTMFYDLHGAEGQKIVESRDLTARS